MDTHYLEHSAEVAQLGLRSHPYAGLQTGSLVIQIVWQCVKFQGKLFALWVFPLRSCPRALVHPPITSPPFLPNILLQTCQNFVKKLHFPMCSHTIYGHIFFAQMNDCQMTRLVNTCYRRNFPFNKIQHIHLQRAVLLWSVS